MIKAIPLSLVDTPDWIYWSKNRNGVYSVKSGYKPIMENEEIDAPGGSDLTERKEVWKKICNLHVPNRIRTLLSRASNDSLPTRVNLVCRKLLQVDTCPNCNLELETITHALWSWPKLDTMWLPQFAKLKEATSSLSNFIEIVHLAQHDPSYVEVFANIISLLWMRKNRATLGEENSSFEKILKQARNLVQEFHHIRSIHTKIPRTARAIRWRPPPSRCGESQLRRCYFLKPEFSRSRHDYLRSSWIGFGCPFTKDSPAYFCRDSESDGSMKGSLVCQRARI
nr:hypothetical protein CFP56_04851 [Quercus suber]